MTIEELAAIRSRGGWDRIKRAPRDIVELLHEVERLRGWLSFIARLECDGTTVLRPHAEWRRAASEALGGMEG